MIRKFILTVFIITNVYSSYGQSTTNLPQVIPPSPSAMQFQKYGDYPVSNNTGIPSIVIPLYTIKAGDIEVPISLSYHASGIKPSDINGFVGVGWVLNCGGIITRTIMDGTDESTDNPNPFYTQAQLDNMQNYQRDGIMYDWEDYYDTESDIFSYNFLGNSGKFVIKKDASFTPLLLPYKPINFKLNASAQQNTSIDVKDINGFQIHFDPTEWPINPGPYSAGPTRWDIKKITSPTDATNYVSFTYNNVTVDFNNQINDQFVLDDDLIDSPFDPLYGCGGLYPFDVMEYFTPQWFHGSAFYNYSTSVNPNIITFKNGQIKFIKNTNSSTVNRIEIYNNNNELTKAIGFTYIQKSVNSILLKEVIFYDANNVFVNKYFFNYYNENFGEVPAAYDAGVDFWGYFNNGGVNQNTGLLPMWEVTKRYGNSNTTYWTAGGNNRESNEDAMKTFVLNEILYPTGGKSVFDFEANRYQRSMNVTYLSGGLRVKSITNYAYPSATPEVKTYKYGSSSPEDGLGVIDFFPGDKSDYSYSERLFILNNGGGVGGSNTAGPWQSFRRRHYFSDPLDNNLSVHGSSVVYPYVTEYIGDGDNNIGKTTYVYDYSSPQYEDLTYLNAQGYNPANEDIIFKKRMKFFQDWTSGNLVSKSYAEYENGSYIDKKDETYEYEFLPGESLRGFYQERTVNYVIQCSVSPQWVATNHSPDQFMFSGYQAPASAYNYADYTIESGEMRLINQTTDIWEDNMQQFLTTTTHFEYSNNIHVQPTSITTTNSKGEELQSVMKYPHDFISQQPYTDMVNVKHIWSPVIEQLKYKKIGATSTFLQSVKTNYDFWNGSNWNTTSTDLIVPRTIETKVLTNNPETRIRYQSYDDKGNITGVSKENDVQEVYIWGYNKTYPVAEVVGASYSSIMGVLNQAILDNPADDAAMRTELNKIRINFPAAFVTTYTYKPLVGMTSQCDANNRMSYYDYDAFGRLVLVRDQDKNILKKICYNYAGQPESCQSFTNTDQSGNYYKQDCPSGQTALAYYVSVPPGMFSSSISVTDANSQALQYAQQQADLYGTCQQLFQVNYTNYGNVENYIAEFWNPSTGADYWFEVGNGSGTLGYVEAATYDIFIYNLYSIPDNNNFSICNNYVYDQNFANFYGITISQSCHNLNIY